MAHTEAQIRQAIKPLLTVHGQLNTSEVKRLLHTVLEFDEDDIIPSNTRVNETLIIQRIGNIVAHQTEIQKIYPEGFLVDKSTSPAVFKLHNPVTNESISQKEVTTLKKATKRFTARKVDWEKVRDQNTEIGDQGEEFAVEYEIDRLTALFGKDSAHHVQHLSRLQGDGLGYDIQSINDDGTIRFIEVKTTSGNLDQPFFMSKNEMSFFHEYKESAFVYRIYEFNKETRHGKIRIINYFDLLSEHIFQPYTWVVKQKNESL